MEPLVDIEYQLSTQIDSMIKNLSSIIEREVRKSSAVIAEVLSERKGVTAVDVVIIACSVTNTTVSNFFIGPNTTETNISRKLAWWYLSEHMNMTHESISIFSKKGRPAVTHAITATMGWIEIKDKTFMCELTEFMSRITLLKSKKITQVKIENYDYATED